MTTTVPLPEPSEQHLLGLTGQDPWRPDVLDGYEALDLVLPDSPPVDGEPKRALVATLVRRSGPRLGRRAVLSIHGYNDYFFHTHLADLFGARGVDFYAIDLRRYGRSLREGQLPSYVGEVAHYFDDLDAALDVIRADHDDIAIAAHSTGGLTAALYVNARPGAVNALMLNSPWLDLHGTPWLTAFVAPMIDTLGRRKPTAAIPLPGNDFPTRSWHVSYGGEWDYNLDWKAPPPSPIHYGWLRAVVRGHEQIAKGLSIDVPVLVALSSRTNFSRIWSPKLRRADIVLDVNQIAKRAPLLGSNVTVVRIKDGMHDLGLSLPEVRARYFEALGTWMDAHWPSHDLVRDGDDPLAQGSDAGEGRA
ncbi:MAG: alpha/beta hydrolase [Propionibacteriaceae bacterium]